MRLPAALQHWAAEHSEQLSQATLDEVLAIASTIADSALAETTADAVDQSVDAQLGDLFDGARSARAIELVHIVAAWALKFPQQQADDDHSQIVTEPEPEPEPEPATPEPATPGPRYEAAPTELDTEPEPEPETDFLSEPVQAPAFLRSDKVDEEDDVRLYGPQRPTKAIFGTLIALLVLAGAAAGAYYVYSQRDTGTDIATDTTDPAPTPANESTNVVPAPTNDPGSAPATAELPDDPTPTPEPTAIVPTYWADVSPILNAGSSPISSSTYAVSPSNRAVLTGHTAAITGIVVTNDGRVLTSGADRRLVDWGADVTLAQPDVLNVPSALTVLTRTVDQRIVAGDGDGNITIIDLVNTADPVVLTVHDVAISAAAELADGRFAIASVDGDVAVFSVDTPDDKLTLSHNSVEVTAVLGMPDGRIATAAVDGIVRLWSADGASAEEIATLQAPVTAIALLGNDQLATASVDGSIHIVPAQQASEPTLVLAGHVGAVRALFETSLANGSTVLASGGDDTTIRLWDMTSGALVRVLEGHGDIISGLNRLPDGRLVSTSGDGTGRVWDLSVASGPPVIAPHDWNLSALHSWNNDQFVTGGIDGKVMLASTAETTDPVLISRHDAPVVGVSVLQNGDIVSLDASSIMRVNQPTGDAAGLVEISVAAGATALDVRDSLGVVTGHADGTVRFHDFAEEVAVVSAHGSGVNDVAALANGMVVSAGQDMTVRIIDFDDPDTVPVFDLHSAPVDVVIELPDGRIASAGTDGIYVWTLEGLSQDHIRLNGQRSRTISLVAISNDRLISTGEDGRVRLWDLNTPEAEPTTLVDIPGVINPHLIQADNGLFVAGAARGYVVFTLS